jgi:sigma-E factor negative regulatory protein RseC
MIEENARVISIYNDDVIIEPVKGAGCSGCKQGSSCGVSLFSNFFGNRDTRYRAVNLSTVPLQPGDRVVVGIDEHAILGGSLIVYALPLFMLVMAAAAGGALAASMLPGYSEMLAIFAALCGFAGGLVMTRHISRRIVHDARYQPVILRRNDD